MAKLADAPNSESSFQKGVKKMSKMEYVYFRDPLNYRRVAAFGWYRHKDNYIVFSYALTNPVDNFCKRTARTIINSRINNFRKPKYRILFKLKDYSTRNVINEILNIVAHQPIMCFPDSLRRIAKHHLELRRMAFVAHS